MMSPGCMFSVAMIQRFRLPPATRAMSADLHGEPTVGGEGLTTGATARARGRARAPHSPARVVSDVDDLLGEGLLRGPLLVAQPLEVDHAVPPLVSPADPPHTDAACGDRAAAAGGSRSRPGPCPPPPTHLCGRGLPSFSCPRAEPCT